ncbi:Uncharacterised protein [Klebsiella pneumoniae]|nr:Uncharacterised protein [Shigella flexneri]SWT57221.1 Uncharacterised protein [Klebsiella pneumoniae]
MEAISIQITRIVMMCNCGPHLPSKISTPMIGVNGKMA